MVLIFVSGSMLINLPHKKAGGLQMKKKCRRNVQLCHGQVIPCKQYSLQIKKNRKINGNQKTYINITWKLLKNNTLKFLATQSVSKHDHFTMCVNQKNKKKRLLICQQLYTHKEAISLSDQKQWQLNKHSIFVSKRKRHQRPKQLEDMEIIFLGIIESLAKIIKQVFNFPL